MAWELLFSMTKVILVVDQWQNCDQTFQHLLKIIDLIWRYCLSDQPHSGEKLNKFNQCDFASFYASALRRHLKTHSGEKSNKCNQCYYVSSHAGSLGRHLKTHKQMQSMWLYLFSGRKPEETFENSQWRKSNKCNQWDYASGYESDLRKHLITHTGKILSDNPSGPYILKFADSVFQSQKICDDEILWHKCANQ